MTTGLPIVTPALAGSGPDPAEKRRRRRMVLDLLPELAPAGRSPGLLDRLRARFLFIDGSVRHESTRFAERAEAHDLTAILTVYTLNLTVLIVAFPVGFGLLIFNILGGENLRTTAHVLALTGFAMALQAEGLLAFVSPFV